MLLVESVLEAQKSELNIIYWDGFDKMKCEILLSNGEKKIGMIYCGGRSDRHKSITINYI